MGGEARRKTGLDAPPLVPLLAGRWQVLQGADRAQVAALADLAWAGLVPGPSFSMRHPVLEVRALALPFYPGWVLLELDAQAGPGLRGTCNLLWGPGLVQPVNGRSDWIHALNDGTLAAPGQADGRHRGTRMQATEWTTQDTAAYLRFYCACLWSGDRPDTFRIVESPTDAALWGARPGAWRRKLGPVQVELEGARRSASVCMLQAGHLMRVRLVLETGGRVQLVDQVPLAHDIVPPERVMAPLRSVVSVERVE